MPGGKEIDVSAKGSDSSYDSVVGESIDELNATEDFAGTPIVDRKKAKRQVSRTFNTQLLVVLICCALVSVGSLIYLKRDDSSIPLLSQESVEQEIVAAIESQVDSAVEREAVKTSVAFVLSSEVSLAGGSSESIIKSELHGLREQLQREGANPELIGQLLNAEVTAFGLKAKPQRPQHAP